MQGDRAAIRAALDASTVAALKADPRLLFEAMRLDYADVVGLLLSLGADPNAVQDGIPALVYNPSPERVKLLLDAGADVARFGEDALHASLGNVPVMRLLLEAGVDLHVIAPEEVDGHFENPELAVLLADAGFDLGGMLANAVYNSSPEQVKFLLELKGKRKWSDTPGVVGLAAAAAKVRTLKLLLDAGYKPSGPTPALTTPLHLAATCGDPRVVKLLLAAGAKVEALDAEGRSPLMAFLAWPFPKPALVKPLLDAGAKLERKDREGRTALTLARLGNHPALARLLRKRGAKEQPQFEAEVLAKEAEYAEKARVSASNHARALASFERRNGKSGKGKSTGGAVSASPGHAVRLSGKRVAIWFPQHYPPSEVITEPGSNWVWGRGQDPGPPRRAPKKTAQEPTGAALQARLDVVEAEAAAGGVTLGPGMSDASITQVEEALQTTFPAPLREWLRRHGSKQEVSIDGMTDLLSLAHMVEFGRGFIQMAPEVAELGWGWGPGLVPLAHNSGGDYASLDLRPDSKAPGQVLMVWHDAEPRVEAPSFLAWLDGLFWGNWQ